MNQNQETKAAGGDPAVEVTLRRSVGVSRRRRGVGSSRRA